MEKNLKPVLKTWRRKKTWSAVEKNVGPKPFGFGMRFANQSLSERGGVSVQGVLARAAPLSLRGGGVCISDRLKVVIKEKSFPLLFIVLTGFVIKKGP